MANQFDEERNQDLYEEAKIDDACETYKGTITYVVTKNVRVFAENMDCAEDIAIDDVFDEYKNNDDYEIDIEDVDLTKI